MVTDTQKRKTKDDWLQAGLRVLEAEGIDAVTVERLARELSISKSGFYWHFKDRRDLLQRMLDYWGHEYTEVIVDNPKVQELAAAERILRVMQMVHDYELARLDLPIRAWARSDKDAALVVQRVTEMRLDFLRAAFRELGFESDDLEMRVRLFLSYHTWEGTMFDKIPEKEREKIYKAQLRLLTS